MTYTLNDYFQIKAKHGARIVIFPSNGIAAKLVTEYRSRGFEVIPCWQLVDSAKNDIPLPTNVMANLLAKISGGASYVLTGVDAYLAFLNPQQKRDFLIGLRNFIEGTATDVCILLSKKCDVGNVFKKPVHWEGHQIVEVIGDSEGGSEEATEELPDLHIWAYPVDWVRGDARVCSVVQAMENMGEYIPSGEHNVWLSTRDMPPRSYGALTVVKRAAEVVSTLYGLEAELSEEEAQTLLGACCEKHAEPMEVLREGFGGWDNPSEAAQRLKSLSADKLWNLYAWMLKTSVPPTSYLHQVLADTKDADHFWRNYVVTTAVSQLYSEHAAGYAAERAKSIGSNDPLLAKFVVATTEKAEAIPFMNCGSDIELQGLIRHAARYELMYGLPANIQKVAPELGQYLALNYDYGNRELTEYFSRLRCLRMCNCVDEDFVALAYSATVPYAVKKRKDIIASYDDGATALLIVDGMGAEYYPLLMNLAKQNHIGVLESRVVQASLPTSTKFNDIPWTASNRLREIKQTDNISHSGYAAHENCSYEENLVEIIRVFSSDVMHRIIMGLSQFKRVLVTADHGSSYLAVLAHQNKMNKTLPWNGTPDDWRYAAVANEITTPEGMIAEYRANEQRTYYVVKGYNRLPKEGGKKYALHGGASLEEILVPFVVFSNDAASEVDPQPAQEVSEQFSENDGFDLL